MVDSLLVRQINVRHLYHKPFVNIRIELKKKTTRDEKRSIRHLTKADHLARARGVDGDRYLRRQFPELIN